MPRFKLGKLDAVRPHGVSDLAVYVRGALPKPPASVDFYSGVSLPMDANDRLGCCVMAATAHLIAAWDNEVHEADHVPDADEVVAEYFKLTGGEDTGLNESSVLNVWASSGLFNDRIAGYAPVNPQNVIAIQQAIAFYGGAMFGIQCPASAQEQFANGQPWTYDPSSPIEGGHAIAPLGYTDRFVWCATWGGVAPVTYPFLSALLDECWCVIPQAFVEAGHGPAVDIATLRADLNLV